MIEDDIATPAPMLRQEIRRLRKLLALNDRFADASNANDRAVGILRLHLCGIVRAGGGCACTGHCAREADVVLAELEAAGLVVLALNNPKDSG